MPDPLRRRVRARVLEALAGAARHAPRRGTRAALGALARAAAITAWEGRIRANLELALGAETGPAERRKIARGVRLHAARQVEEWLFLSRARGGGRERERVLAWLAAEVVFDATCAPLLAAAGEKRGALIATAHIGNWEVLAAALRRLGLDGAVVGARKRRDPAADWLARMRAGLGVRTLWQDSPPREVLGVLREGGTLGVLCDLEVRRLAGVHAPFFGRPALTQTAPAALARASGLPVVPVRCVARGKGYVVSAEEPIAWPAGLARERATLALLERLNAVYERWIRADPEQWAWHQPRWRTLPEEGAFAPLAARRAAAGGSS